MQIIGVERVDYTSKKTGRQVTGWRVFFTEERPGITGVRCDSEFITEYVGKPFFSSFASLDDCLGVEIEFSYRRYGNNFQIDQIRGL